MTSPHAYKILGLSQDSDKQEIKKKYRQLMHQVHPVASFRLRACCISSVLRIFDRRSASGRIINLADDFSVFYQIIHISANRNSGKWITGAVRRSEACRITQKSDYTVITGMVAFGSYSIPAASEKDFSVPDLLPAVHIFRTSTTGDLDIPFLYNIQLLLFLLPYEFR